MTNDYINDALFSFLKAIYAFEQKEKAEFSLSWQDMLLLKHLRLTNQLTMGDVTQLLHIQPFQTTRLVDNLVKKMFVERFEGQEDGRVKCLRIAPHGLLQLDRLDAYHVSVVTQAAKDLGPSATKDLLAMLFQLNQLLGV